MRPDLRCIKEKFGQARSASHTRHGSSVRDLEIGAPVLISTTAEDMNLVPLSSLQPPKSAPLRAPQYSPSFPPSLSAKLREFSPLGSHPVDPAKDLHLAAPVNNDMNYGRRRSRSEAPRPRVAEISPEPYVVRANSSETRRTKLFSNEPWVQSPSFPQTASQKDPVEVTLAPAPVLERPSFSLEPPSLDVRPTSSHGGDQSPGLRQSAFDTNKELPPLPRYIVPAPLFACNSVSSSPTTTKDPENIEEEHMDDTETSQKSESNSHFSTWSTELSYSLPTSDDEAIHSPTFSSLTSCSDLGSPTRLSARFSISDYMHSPDSHSSPFGEEEHEGAEEEASKAHLSATPPQLNELRISTFGSSLFDMDMPHGDSGSRESRGSRSSRRQVACFGLGFQGYKLPEDESTSKVTITEPKLRPESLSTHDRGSSVSQVETLVNEFGFLGEAVV
jgi:hypothetical protein